LRAIFGQDLLAIALIGSRANGYATPKSDVDLHVILRNEANKQHVGLRRKKILGAEVHVLAVTENTLVKGATDVINQPMENVCLTLFAYKAFWGCSHFENVSQVVRQVEWETTEQWLILQGVEFTSNEQLVTATILRKLMWAPPLVERWQRKVEEVGLDCAWNDAAKNLGLVEERPASIASDPKIILASPMLAIRNLLALTSRHNNLSRDMKAMVNGIIYGPIFLAVACYEASQIKRARLDIRDYLNDPPAGITKWIQDTSRLSGVAGARQLRNKFKDYVV